MVTFREFLATQQVQPTDASAEKWKATKEEILNYWKNLRADTPILMKPISPDHKGSTYSEDGVRITGSPQFIGSVMSRLKELLQHETPSSKLSVTYRETESPSQMAMGQSKTSYVFYVQARQRG
jgi:hypothetical protein